MAAEKSHDWEWRRRVRSSAWTNSAIALGALVAGLWSGRWEPAVLYFLTMIALDGLKDQIQWAMADILDEARESFRDAVDLERIAADAELAEGSLSRIEALLRAKLGQPTD